MLMLGVAAGLAVVQYGLHLLARGLDLRIHRAAVVVALSLAAVLVGGFVAGDRILFPTIVTARNVPDAPPSLVGENYSVLNDAVYQLIPWESEIRRALRMGRLPLWSDRLDGGSSPWVNPQAGALSPVAMIARLAPLEHHLLAALAFKMVIAFQGAWLLARLLGSRRFFALLAGAGFALGGGIMPWSLFPLSTTAAWVPWLAVASIRLARRWTPRSIAVAAVITAFMLLSGHPETAFGGGLLAVVCVVSFGRRSRGFRGAAPALAAASIAAVLGFAIAAPHILPFVRYLPHTVRYHEMSGLDAVESSQSGELLNPRRARLLESAVTPNAFGGAPYSQPGFVPRKGGGYAGVVALAGAAIAVAVGKRRSWPLLAFGLTIGLMIAEFLPLDVVRQLPVAGVVEWTRLITFISLVVAVCGAVGLSELARRRRARLLLAALAAMIVSLLVSPEAYVGALWAGAIAALVVTVFRPKLAMVALTAVMLADLGPWSSAMLPKGDPGLFYPETTFMAGLTREVQSLGNCRVVGHSRNLYPSLLSVYGIADIRHHNPVADHAYAQVLDAVLGFHPGAISRQYTSPIRRLPGFLGFLNVGIVVSSAPSLPGRFEALLTEEHGPRAAFRCPRTLPLAFLPKDTVIVDPDDILSAVASSTDPRVVVLSRDEAVDLDLPPPHWWPLGVASSTDATGRVQLRLRRKGGVLVATSLTNPRGWMATAEESRLRTISVNHAFLGVVVPPGVDTVDLEFAPPGLKAGAICGALGLVGVVGLLLWGARRDLRLRRRPS